MRLNELLWEYVEWASNINVLASDVLTPDETREMEKDRDEGWANLVAFVPGLTASDPLLGLLETADSTQHAFDYHPANMGVNPGCDCGCGGDSVTDEEWDAFPELEKAKDNARAAVVKNLEERGIEVTPEETA